MSEQRQLSLTASADGSQIRTAMFNGKQNLVVPVVALLGNAVVRPMNSRGAEFVPEKELASSPAGWNGRPIVPDHPDGGRASANSPTVLESQSFGHVFGARYEDGRLKMEAWLDPERAEKVGPLAQEVIRRCREGKMVEVSVGVWVTALQKKGSHNGAEYEYEWAQIVPDHLAMLPEGVPGACSVKMGCGARARSRARARVRAPRHSAALARATMGTQAGRAKWAAAHLAMAAKTRSSPSPSTPRSRATVG